MKRTMLKRKTKLRALSLTPRPHLNDDPEYLAWLREHRCVAPGPHHLGGDAHHARHQQSGASMGAHMKDDHRAIALCRGHHQDVELGQGPFVEWPRERIKAWENEWSEALRKEYLEGKEST